MKKKKIIRLILIIGFIIISLIGIWGIFGCPIDRYNGVNVYINTNSGKRNIAKDGYNIGLKYQCVEFVKRYYLIHLKHKMPYSYGHARDFYNKGLKDGQRSVSRNLVQYTNPSRTKPRVDDILVFSPLKGNPYGHVAIISKVTDNKIVIVQQNTGLRTRATFTLKKTGNWWEIYVNALGWLRKE